MEDIKEFIPNKPVFVYQTYDEDGGLQSHTCRCHSNRGDEYYCKNEEGNEVLIVRQRYFPDPFIVMAVGDKKFMHPRDWDAEYAEVEEYNEKADFGALKQIPPPLFSRAVTAKIILEHVQVKSEGYVPELVFESNRPYIKFINEGGHNSASVDLNDLINWLKLNIPGILK